MMNGIIAAQGASIRIGFQAAKTWSWLMMYANNWGRYIPRVLNKYTRDINAIYTWLYLSLGMYLLTVQPFSRYM